jgi:hypothetical protein
MRAFLSSDWLIPMLGGFIVGGAVVFGIDPVLAAIF